MSSFLPNRKQESTQMERRKMELHSGEETPNQLPEQVIMEEILPRLPVKSLLKFRCVSKPWCSLIGSKRFIKAHLKYSIKNSWIAHKWIIFDYFEKKFKKCCLPSLFDNAITVPIAYNVDLGIDFKCALVASVACCNGLVCILVDTHRFILWNPATKKIKNLPDFNNGMRRGGIILKYGFGFDELNEDYKVFGIETVFGVDGNYSVIVKVYSLRSNSWKDVEIGNISPIGNAGIYVSGKLHRYNSKCGIVSFDLNRHVPGVVELPSYTNGVAELGVLGGFLSAYFRHPNRDLDVWLMKEYGVKESWVKMVTLPYYDHPDSFETPSPFAIAPNGEILLVYNSDIVIYNPNSDVFRRHHVTGLDNMFDCIECMGIDIESLALVEC